MPLFALALVLTFDLHPAVKVALVALSVSPIPPILPKKSLKAGGKENYTIGLLVAIAVLAIVVIPVTMEILERVFGVPFQVTGRLVAVVVLATIRAPLLVGIGVRAIAPSIGDRAAKPIAIIATVLLVVSILPVLFSARRAILSLVGDDTLIGMIGFALVGLAAGHLLGSAGGGDPLSDRERVSVSEAGDCRLKIRRIPNRKYKLHPIMLASPIT